MKIVIHSNYLLNFCSNTNKIQWALNYYLNELKLANDLNCLGCIIHVGAKKDLNKQLLIQILLKI